MQKNQQIEWCENITHVFQPINLPTFSLRHAVRRFHKQIYTQISINKEHFWWLTQFFQPPIYPPSFGILVGKVGLVGISLKKKKLKLNQKGAHPFHWILVFSFPTILAKFTHFLDMNELVGKVGLVGIT